MPVQGEKSERVLELTADMINSNSADYTAWQYRWDTLIALKSDLQRECSFTE
jgi:protein farnesyltransferase/geranylgeranyltransferase type-1 subunit alpha